MPLEFGRVIKEICEHPDPEALAPRQLDQPEPFGHRRTHRLLDRPDVNLGGAAVPQKALGPKIHVVLQARAQSVETEEVLVTLGLDHDASDLEPAEIDRRLEIIAIVKWGQGAASFRAEVDWRNGVQISFPCAFIEVGAQFLEPAEPGTYRKTHVQAAYAWGSSANRSFPTRTFPRVTLEEIGSATIIRIPPFAYSLLRFRNMDSAAVDAEFLGGPLVTDRSYGTVTSTILDECLCSEGVRIPGGARFVRLTNVGPAGSNDVTAMFALNL